MRESGAVPMPAATLKSLSREVVRWFGLNPRDLPWRKSRDPYAIWISEVMLQQTQVKTVIPYWERWMTQFPDLKSLAGAREEAVLKAWEGLGYYSRARNLQKAARKVCSEHSGVFPQAHAEVFELPGVGRYTAGAICSIAYGAPTPILDGNVARVLSRVFMISGSIKDARVQKELWGLSAALVESTTDCSALNQGLMELGATICLPRTPLCAPCPLKRPCQARLAGRVAEFPERAEPPAMRDRQFIAFIFRHKTKVLVRKRAQSVVNGGLWEFPNIEIKRGDNANPHAERFDLKPLRTIKHTITRNRITLHAFAGPANGNAKALAGEFDAEWHPLADLEKLPFSSAHARLRALLWERHGSANKAVVA
jgi:A/G-specific adenine glycosylase